MNLIETDYHLNQKEKHIAKVAALDNGIFTNIQLRAGEEIAEHSSKNDAFIIVRKGKIRFTVEGESVVATPENILHMVPLEKHGLHAIEDTDLILIQIKPST